MPCTCDYSGKKTARCCYYIPLPLYIFLSAPLFHPCFGPSLLSAVKSIKQTRQGGCCAKRNPILVHECGLAPKYVCRNECMHQPNAIGYVLAALRWLNVRLKSTACRFMKQHSPSSARNSFTPIITTRAHTHTQRGTNGFHDAAMLLLSLLFSMSCTHNTKYFGPTPKNCIPAAQ